MEAKRSHVRGKGTVGAEAQALDEPIPIALRCEWLNIGRPFLGATGRLPGRAG